MFENESGNSPEVPVIEQVRGQVPKVTTHQVVVSSVTPAATIENLLIVTGRDDGNGQAIQFNVNAAIARDLQPKAIVNVMLQHNVAGVTTYFKDGQQLFHKRDSISAKSIVAVNRVVTLSDAIAMRSDVLQSQFAAMFV